MDSFVFEKTSLAIGSKAFMGRGDAIPVILGHLGKVSMAPGKKRLNPTMAAWVGLVAWGWIVIYSPPAFADEFKVGILADPTTSGMNCLEFMQGFQIAVDQSPDVSHPPNIEGGDHLGSIDVDMVVVCSADEPTEFVTAAVDLIDREGVAIIVADVESDVLAALYRPVTESARMLIAMSDTGGTEFPETPFFFAATERDGVEALLTDRKPVFEDAFIATYNRMPSTAAISGYLAGRLVDISVEATDRNPFDGQALADGLTRFGFPDGNLLPDEDFQINDFVLTPVDLEITWISTLGATYAIETSDDMSTWRIAADGILAVGATTTGVVDVMGAHGFFRIRRK